MKTNQVNGGLDDKSQKHTFGSACLNSCKEVLAQIKHAKETILAEARGTLKVQEQLLRFALIEAEAVAFETIFPELVFPDLAMEKIRGAAARSERQRLVA
jgi:hypothetical protein